MASVTAAWTTPQVESVTRPALIRRMLRSTKVGWYGTATGGTTTTIVDATKLLSTQYSSDEYVGAFVYMLTGDAAGQIRQVSIFTPGTGTLTVSSAFSVQIDSGDTYAVFTVVHPQDVFDLLDDVLTQDLVLPAWTLLSEIPDGDMEQNNTTDWTASNATVTKITTEPAGEGARYLSVAATAANGRARSNLLNVVPGKQYYSSLLARCSAASTTAKMVIYDETNSVEIASVSTISLAWGRLWKYWSAPTTCYQVSMRPTVVEDTKTGLFDSAVMFAPGDTDIALPWWVRNQDQVKFIGEVVQANSHASEVVDPSLNIRLDERWDVRGNGFGTGQHRLHARYGGLSRPMVIMGARNETAYSSDTEAKRVPADYVLAGLCVKVLELAIAEASGADTDSYRDMFKLWSDKWSDAQRRLGSVVRPVMRSPSPWVSVYAEPSHTRRFMVR